MNFLSVDEVRKRYTALFKRIPDSENVKQYISFEETGFDCEPYVEVDSSGYHYRCKERGKLIEDRVTTDIEELLYWLIKDITFNAAVEYELYHRVKYQDNRRIIHIKELELLSYVDENYRNKRREEIETGLLRSSYNDLLHKQLDLIDDVERLAEELQKFLEGDNSCEARYAKGEIDAILSFIKDLHRHGSSNLEETLSVLYEKHRRLYPQQGGLSGYFIWREDFQERKEANESFDTVKQELKDKVRDIGEVLGLRDTQVLEV